MILQVLAIILGKSVYWLIKLLGSGGGFAAPGYYSLKLNSNFLSFTSNLLPTTIIVTGTNGKTTTCRMISHFFKGQKVKVLKNPTGSNLERGVVSSLLQSFSTWELLTSRSNKYQIALWELDEAAFNQVAPKLSPNSVVFLNIYRDQLDRYGEIDSTVKKWCQTLPKMNQNCQILINGDDPNLDQLAEYAPGEVKYFGVKDQKIKGETSPAKLKPKQFSYQAYQLQTQGLTSQSFKLSTYNHPQSLTINLPLPGLYHVYDFLAAWGALDSLNFPAQMLISDIKTYSPAFGRMEQVQLPEGKTALIFLIKNPTGTTQVIETIKGEIEPVDRLLLALNDNFADGTDVSWIWDAEFEKLDIKHSLLNIIISGQRASDLALRLKYAGFEPTSFTIEPDLKPAFHQAKQNLKGRLFILLTYTCLLELQNILKELKIKPAYWKES